MGQNLRLGVAGGEARGGGGNVCGKRRARRQCAEGPLQGRYRRSAVKIAVKLDFDRPVRQRPAPDLAEAFGRCLLDFRRAGCAIPRIAVALKIFEIALQHALRRCGEGFILQSRRCLGTDHRVRIPARHGEFGGKQVELVSEIGASGVSGKFECGILNLEIKAHFSAGGNTVELFLAEGSHSRADQRHVAERDIGRITGAETAIAAAEADLHRHPARLVRGRPDQHFHAIGKLQPLDAQQPGRRLADKLAGRTERRQLVEVDGLGGEADIAASRNRRQHRLSKRRAVAFARLGRDQQRPRRRPGEQRAGVGQHRVGGEQRFRAAEDAQHICRRGDGLLDVERHHQIVSDFRSGQQPLLLDRHLIGDFHLRRLAVDLLLGRRARQRVGDHRANIAQRARPVVAERRHRYESAVDRTVDILLADLGHQIAAPGPRLGLKPPVNQRLRHRIDHQPLIIDNIIRDRPPRSQDRIVDHARQFGLDQHPGLANRIGRIGAGRGHRIAEAGGRRALARHAPAGEPLLHQRGQRCGRRIPGGDDHGVFRPVPTRMEGADGGRMRTLQCFLRPDRRANGEQLASIERCLRGILYSRRRAAALALFSEHDRHLCADIGFRKGRRGDHAGEQLEAFIQRGRRRVGQIELVDCLRRRGFRIGIRAEAGAKALPGRDRLRRPEIFGLAEHQMLNQMGKAALTVAFVERADIHADADRHLVRRHPVLPHGIAHPVGQLTEHPVRILRHIAAAVEPGRGFGLAPHSRRWLRRYRRCGKQ